MSVAASPHTHRTQPGPAARTWLPWFLGFLLVALGWAALTPVNQYPDEADHVYRAVSVVRGSILPLIGAYDHGTGAVAPVPRGIHELFAESGPCRGVGTTTRCEDVGDPGSVTVVTSEGRMFPLYYAAIGWPSLMFPNGHGLLLMRALNGLLVAALLATAATVLMSMALRPVVAAAGLFASLTPLALYLTGSTNPSAPETAAAVCFWATVLALIHGNSVIGRDRLMRYAAVSGIVLATSRMLGLFWIVLALGLSLLSAERRAHKPFLRAVAAPVLAPVAAAGAVMAMWTVVFRSHETFASLTPVELMPAEILAASARNTGKLLQEIVAYFGWLTVKPPVPVLVAWALIVVLLVTIAWSAGTRRSANVTLITLALVLVLPFVFQVASFPRAGLGGWQGRYTLPLAVGVPLLAIVTVGVGRLGRVRVVGYAWAIVGLAGVGHLVATVDAATAFDPPTGPVLLVTGLALLALGGFALAMAVVRADHRVAMPRTEGT